MQNFLCLSFLILQFIAPKGLAAFGSIDILHKKCFHHFVMETFWRYELQNVETQNALTLTFQERCATVLSDVFKTMARKRFIHEFMEEDGRV